MPIINLIVHVARRILGRKQGKKQSDYDFSFAKARTKVNNSSIKQSVLKLTGR